MSSNATDSKTPDQDLAQLPNQELATRPAEALSPLECLPQEVLVSIWKRLDSPSSLSMTSPYLNAFGKDTFVRAQYFLFKFAKYEVIYKAIAHPKLFDKTLFQLLIHGGALLSRALAEAICIAFADRGLSSGPPHHTTWGRSINLDTYAAIIGHVGEVYGEEFSLKGMLDSELFDQWLHEDSFSFEIVSELFETFKFMPLPPPVFHGIGNDTDLDAIMIRSIRKMPKILTLAEKNGYTIFAKGFVDSVVRSIFCKNSTPQEVVAELTEQLQDDRFYVSKTVASQIIVAKFKPGHSRPSIPYEALKLCQPLIKFNLIDLVFEVVTSFITTHFDQDIMEFVDNLTSDFPSMPNPLNHYHQLLSIFIKAEKQLPPHYSLVDIQDEDRLAQVHSMVGTLEVTNSHIYAIFFSNLIGSTLCVSYARKYVEGFDERAFFVKLLEPSGILTRPYKGRQLKELLQRSDQQRTGFGALLERTIVSKAIDIQKLPLGSNNGSQSILTYEWGLLPYRTNTRTYSYLPSGFQELWNATTNPIIAEPSQAPSSFEILKSFQKLKDEPAPELHRKKMKALSDFGPGAFMSINEARLKDSNPSRPMHSRRSLIDDLGSSDDVHGRVHPDSISIASVTLEYFGPLNLTAVPIILEHSIISYHNKVMTEYLDQGVPVTLFHFQMAARVGLEPPSRLLDMLKSGVFFVRSGNRRDGDDENDSFLLRSRASLNAQEKRDLAGNTTTQGSRRGVFSSPTLQRILQTEESPNPVYLVVATCEPPPFVNRARTDEEKKVSLRKWYEHLCAIGKLEKRKHEIRKVSSGSSKTDKTPFHLHLEKTILPTLKALLQ